MAATSPNSAPLADGKKRMRITARVQGKVAEWTGTRGWIKPAEALNHPDANKSAKGLYVTAFDLLPKNLVLKKDMPVTFFAYTDGTGKLGAESVMEFKGSLMEAPGTGPLVLPQQKAKPSLATLAGTHFPKAVQTKFQKLASPAPAKGGGKHKGKRKAPTKPRTRVTHGAAITGTVLEWKGSYGWVLPDEPIDHAKASERQGHLYLNQFDLLDASTPQPGQTVNFHVYEDSSGLGAMECIAT